MAQPRGKGARTSTSSKESASGPAEASRATPLAACAGKPGVPRPKLAGCTELPFEVPSSATAQSSTPAMGGTVAQGGGNQQAAEARHRRASGEWGSTRRGCSRCLPCVKGPGLELICLLDSLATPLRRRAGSRGEEGTRAVAGPHLGLWPFSSQTNRSAQQAQAAPAPLPQMLPAPQGQQLLRTNSPPQTVSQGCPGAAPTHRRRK